MRNAVLVDYDEDLFDLQPEVRLEMETRLAQVGSAFHASQLRTQQAVLERSRHADLVLIQSLRPLINREVIEQLERCRGIIRVGIGYDSVDVAAATRMGIPVSNVVGWCDHEVAEHALGLLLDCARRLSALDRSVRRGEWARTVGRPARRVAGKTLGIIGLGRIGSMLADKATGLGLQVLAYDPHLPAEVIRRCRAQPASLEELLANSDFVSLHVPFNAATYHLISSAELSQIKHGAVLINTSRGGVLDETALCQALQERRISAAGLDVFSDEPLPVYSPLRGFENVILTPHMGSYSQEAVAEMYRQSADLAAELLSGRWVDSIVNPQVRQQTEDRWRSLNKQGGG